MSEARARTLDLIVDLSDEQMIGTHLAIVNPLRWVIAHVAWFQEYWLLRRLRQQKPALSHGVSLYDSARVAHDTRWELPLPPKAETVGYMQLILDRVSEQSQPGEVCEVNGSAPWFGDHKVLCGGCWATRSRLIRNNYRNFYKPDRRDVWAGFRACALSNER